MDQFIASASQLFEAGIGWVGSVGQAILEQPILLAFTALPLVGIGVGLFKRLINVN